MDIEDASPLMAHVVRSVHAFGKVWHGYEVEGWENLPTDRGCLVVVYHGFFPVDCWYFAAAFHFQTGRILHSLADRWMFKVPGLAWLISNGGAVPGTRPDAVSMLREGHTVLVSPGGVREALSGNRRNYEVIWGDRLGFAKVAVEAGVDVVPIFGENVDEAYRSPGCDTKPLQALYERTRWPLVPVVGMGLLPWPVKMRTWIGEPIRFEPDRTVEQLRDETRDALQKLMDEHQSGRPRLPRALLARLRG